MSTVWIRFPNEGYRDYPIVVKPGALDDVGQLAHKHVKGRHACIVSHPRIYKLYGKKVFQSLKKAGMKVDVFLVPEGEHTKSMATAEKVIGKMIRSHADRASFVVALGGGVVGDLSGFIAATYMRGIDFIQIPTTLLAQVDSSVGGKVAVNHALGKNLIGAFQQPRLVVTDPDVLQTLAKRQLCSGMAEMLKAGMIADGAFFNQLEKKIELISSLEIKSLSWAIAVSCQIKGSVVEKDEREHGLRAILNYGHTFGHALETYHHYSGYLHGEAVAVGMVIAARLAYTIGMCSEATCNRQIALIARAGLPIRGKAEKVEKILQLMKSDKKVRAGETNFILTPHMGHARIVKKIPSFSVRRVLKAVLGSA